MGDGILIKTEIEIPDIESVKGVAVNRARREALLEIMRRHKKKLRNRTRSKTVWNQIKGFRRRSKDYNIRKGRIRADTKGQPHRFFGGTEKRIRAANPTGKPKQAFINITGLNPGYKRRPGGNRPNMFAELQGMTPAEQQEYATLFEKYVVDYINNNPKARKKKRKKS